MMYIISCAQSCIALCDPLGCSPPGYCSIGFFRQEYLSGLPYPPPEDLLNPGIKPVSVMSPALAVRFLITPATWEGVGCSFCLQGIFLTQGMNQISCPAGRFLHSHPGSPYSQLGGYYDRADSQQFTHKWASLVAQW